MARVAGDMRSRANLRSPAFSTQRIISVCFPEAIVTGRKLPDGILEMVTMTDSGAPLIVYRRGLSSCEQRFAIAHALGHILYDFDSRGRLTSSSLSDPVVESRADDLALELLAPLSMVSLHARDLPIDGDSLDQEEILDQIDRIASGFQVPSWAIAKQIRRLRD